MIGLESDSNMYCTNCGAQLGNEQRFCPECGTARAQPRSRGQQPAAPAPAEPPDDARTGAATPAPAAPEPPAPESVAPAPAATPEPAVAPATAAPTAAAAAPAPGAPRPDSTGLALRLLTTPRVAAPSAGPLELVGPLAMSGVALVVAGSVLPLFSAAGTSVSTWDVPAGLLFSDTPSPSGFKLGVVLLAALLAALPLITRRTLSPIMLLLIAAPAANAAVNIYVRKLRTDMYPDLGFGLALIMAGAALIAAEALRPCWRALREMAP